MNKLVLAILANLGLMVLYSITAIIANVEDPDAAAGFAFVAMLIHAAAAFFTGIIILIVQASRQKSLLFAIGFLISAPLLFVIGFATCVASISGMSI